MTAEITHPEDLGTDHIADPLRLAHRDVIRQVVYDVVTSADDQPIAAIRSQVARLVCESDRESVQALIVEELRRLHEGSLSRYRLRPSEFLRWKERLGSGLS